MKIKFHALYSIVISVISVCPLLLPTVAYNGSEEVGDTGAGIGAFLWWLESICCLADHLFFLILLLSGSRHAVLHH
ncbi:hypothetical protein J3E69DRAFT_330688 [Trichoderma sp. SZMC 28015]